MCSKSNQLTKAEMAGEPLQSTPYIQLDRWMKDFDALDLDPVVRPLIFKENALRVLGLPVPTIAG